MKLNDKRSLFYLILLEFLMYPLALGQSAGTLRTPPSNSSGGNVSLPADDFRTLQRQRTNPDAFRQLARTYTDAFELLARNYLNGMPVATPEIVNCLHPSAPIGPNCLPRPNTNPQILTNLQGARTLLLQAYYVSSIWEFNFPNRAREVTSSVTQAHQQALERLRQRSSLANHSGNSESGVNTPGDVGASPTQRAGSTLHQVGVCNTRVRFSESERGSLNSTGMARLNNLGLPEYVEPLRRSLARPRAETYADILRSLAIQSMLRSAIFRTGTPITDVPASCGGYRQAFTNVTGASRAMEGFNLQMTDEGLKMLRVAAIEYGVLMRPAHAPRTPTQMGSARQEFEGTSSNSGAAATAILDRFPALSFPQVLEAAQAPTFNPQRLRAAIQAVLPQLRGQFRTVLEQLCTTAALSDSDLATDPRLSRQALSTFPEFRSANACFAQMGQRRQQFDRAVHTALTACFVGSFLASGGSAAAFGGAVCRGLFIATGAREFLESRRRLEWLEVCRVAGNSQCNQTQYMAAQSRYAWAVFNLGTNVATESFIALRSLSGRLTVAELEQAATRLEEASRMEGQAQGARVREVLATRGSATPLQAITATRRAEIRLQFPSVPWSRLPQRIAGKLEETLHLIASGSSRLRANAVVNAVRRSIERCAQ